ncbi:type II toxin-antitoxin system PemK/MazF family toxin [Candidatus Woesearchaeota archaeon]|nr:type II toxin-antitoxin system PemK/MazF family toxin [Candidatus Woesearchaeota archaeon]
MFRPGDVILAKVQYTDTFEIKKRPALILFEEYSNVVIAGITSNRSMNGISLTVKDGAIKDCVIKLNYIFTISEKMVEKVLFTLSKEKKDSVYKQLSSKLDTLIS